jgi:hypothetical protein
MIMNKQYTNRDLQGPYGFSFDGSITLALPDGSHQAVPIAALGRVDFDGQGKTTAVRTLNFGGQVVLEQTAQGEYSVNPDGTARARFEVVTEKVIGSLPPGVELPPKNVETFAAVLSGNGRENHVLGTGFLHPETEEPLAAVVARGTFNRQ